jgi:hypothetical protein
MSLPLATVKLVVTWAGAQVIIACATPEELKTAKPATAATATNENDAVPLGNSPATRTALPLNVALRNGGNALPLRNAAVNAVVPHPAAVTGKSTVKRGHAMIVKRVISSCRCKQLC